MTKNTTKTVADFRSAHDPNVIIPTKINAALAAMRKEGPEQWDYEGDFLRRAGINVTQLSRFRDQFSAYVIEASGVNNKAARRIWFGDCKVASKIRED